MLLHDNIIPMETLIQILLNPVIVCLTQHKDVPEYQAHIGIYKKASALPLNSIASKKLEVKF